MVRHWIVFLAVHALLVAAWPAQAQEPGGSRMERGGPPQGRPMPMQPRRQDGAQQEQGQAAPGGNEGQPGHRGRMSPGERQQLRRDVTQHGREVYRGRHDERRR